MWEQTWCGNEDFEMILLQAYLYNYSLLKGVTFKVLPMSSYALRLISLPLSKTFLELLLWNTFHCHSHIFLDVFNILKSSSLYDTLFLEIARSYLEPNQGNRVSIPFQ
jgi:hypothetical protein